MESNPKWRLCVWLSVIRSAVKQAHHRLAFVGEDAHETSWQCKLPRNRHRLDSGGIVPASRVRHGFQHFHLDEVAIPSGQFGLPANGVEHCQCRLWPTVADEEPDQGEVLQLLLVCR